MYPAYRFLTYLSAPILKIILQARLSKGKELPSRYLEKTSNIRKNRPEGALYWVHGASVGEAQSALILINKITETTPDIHILVTTGTVTSAELMAKKLPKNAFHQFYPLDHPGWVKKFLDHWKPDAVLWMESELWPNMLHAIHGRQIPAALINARMSEKSFKAWRRFPKLAKETIQAFEKILCQTDTDQRYYQQLGAKHTFVTDNLKYSASPLSCDIEDLNDLTKACAGRPMWVYASTHNGEEQIAHKIQKSLVEKWPDLLTIIVPRHPERRQEIKAKCAPYDLKTIYRGENKALPDKECQIYIADTLGELGLFYALSPIACIGRSLSLDGGGGHNPIEAAQLGRAVLHGENIQNLKEIYDEMHEHNAAISVKTASELESTLITLLKDDRALKALQDAGLTFANKKTNVINTVLTELYPLLPNLNKADLIATEKKDYAT